LTRNCQVWRGLARAIAECRYLLRELDPEGTARAAAQVGLVTHKDCERALAFAAQIQRVKRLVLLELLGFFVIFTCMILMRFGL
jgi:hypothetical protein